MEKVCEELKLDLKFEFFYKTYADDVVVILKGYKIKNFLSS